MTDQSDTDAAHLGLDALGDLDEGLLSPADAESARAHLAGCARCQDDHAALASVHELLADEREIPMPDDVAQRIFGALAALPPLTEADRPAPEPVGATVTTLPQRREPKPWLKPLLISLTAAAGIALVTAGIINLPSSSGSTAASAGAAGTSAAAATTQPPVTLTDTGRAYTSTALGPQGLALLPGQATAANSVAGAAATTAAAAATTGGAAPVATGAAAAASATSAGSSPAAGGSAEATAAAPALTPDVLASLRQPGPAQTCLESYEPSSGAPLAIDIGTFNGKPAIVGVFQDPNNSGRLQVVAAGPPGCSLYQLSLVSKP